MSYEIPAVEAVKATSATTAASAVAMPIFAKVGAMYSQIDPANTGSISQSQFNDAFATLNPPAKYKAAGPQAVWNQLDPNSTGSVAKQDFISGIAKLSLTMRPNGTLPSATSAVAASQDQLSKLNLSA